MTSVFWTVPSGYANDSLAAMLALPASVADPLPTVATVLSSEVDTSGDTTNIDITYEYTVDGETYRSSNIYPGVFDLNSNAESIVADNPEGATVTAYYDPENPSNAFLVKTKNTLLLLLLTVFGVLLTVVGVGQLRARFG